MAQTVPQLSVEEGSPVDDSNPYTALFSVVNEGYWPAKHLDVECRISFVDENGNLFEGIGQVSPEFAKNLYHAS